VESEKKVKEKKNRERKQRRVKEQYPKKSYQGMFRKIFWLGFFSVVGMSALSIIRTVNLENWVQGIQKELVSHRETLDNIPKEEEKQEGVIVVNEEGAKVFASGFATEFYTWDYEDNKAEERSQRLKTYLAAGMDETAGYDISGIKTASKVTACEVWEITTSGDTLNVVVKVDYSLTEQVKEKEKLTDKAAGQGEGYLNVSLVTNGKGFKVKEQPYLVQAPSSMSYSMQAEESDASKLVTDEAACKEIRNFMETFFKFATTGTTEELSYYTTSDVESMKGIYEFLSLEDISIYQEEEGYRVFADCLMEDISTGAEVVLKSNSALVKDKERFVVSEINY